MKINSGHDIEASDVIKRYRTDDGGIPWIAVLGKGGNVLGTSDGPNGNTGFPPKSEDTAHFVELLSKHAEQMPRESSGSVRDALHAFITSQKE